MELVAGRCTHHSGCDPLDGGHHYQLGRPLRPCHSFVADRRGSRHPQEGSASGGQSVRGAGWVDDERESLVVRCVPEKPRLVNPAEQTVWERLRAQCGSGDLLVAGQRVTDHTKDFEIDVIAVLEDAGIVTIEIKGGQVTHDGQSWRQQHGRIDPVNQVRDAKYALRSYVESDPRWGGRARVRWAHLVVLPHTELPAGFALPECPRWSVLDRTQLDQIVDLARSALCQQDSSNRAVTAADVDVLAQVLAGRGVAPA